ncbi:MAG: 3-hydroxyacyl-ACP dehydratase FabZ [Firmicutes bacterium]|nr:3-hydroxyacyl-ACP dehydratase FabZ [Bacillota bacterium]
MDINEIKKNLPHRYPVLLVDRIIEIVKGQRVVGIKNITVNDFYCHQEYLNGDTIYPGVLQVEAMAQVAGIIIMDMLEDKKVIPLFASIDRARFRKMIRPGDQLRIEVFLRKYKARTGKFTAKTYIDRELASEVSFTCMMG